jgi:endonuclease/exonuclease/phosphatase family metal-dependent hydrolase
MHPAQEVGMTLVRMRSLIRSRTLALGGALAAMVALGAPAPSAFASPPPGKGVPVTVMTRNLYLGADINRPLVAVQGITDPTLALLAFAHANSDVRAIVDQTDFPARALLLAHEIATQQPDLVGLQEAALWRTGPLQLTQIGVANAETVKYDYLQLLLDDLAALGTPYVAVEVTTESDVEAPAFSGLPTGSDAQDVRLTMRDAILRPLGGKVKVAAHGGGNYDARIPFSLGGTTYTFIRGYAWADVKVGSKSFRFIDTHLESESSYIANLQAAQLLAGPASQTNKPVVIVCDCNSDPLNSSVKASDPVPTPHYAPYRTITGAGFTDEWLQWAPADQGFTSGLSETIHDPDASKFDHRIDMVFAHTATGDPMPVVYGTVVGTKVSDRNADGLWPSDHGGVVLQIRP